ncbi:MAG TPA: ATP-binding protein [Symbiobacteriaceae bacterium]|nr:ATP-binding protein [Symbiobacteriaceae bacterium]
MLERNQVALEFAAIPENVGVSRLLVATLAGQAGFTIAEIDEVKLAVSEAVTNAVVHGYNVVGADPREPGEFSAAGDLRQPAEKQVRVEVGVEAGLLTVAVIDQGRGMEDVAWAMQPAVSSDPERMGLGFAFMQSHMDSLAVDSAPGQGTRVTMTKRAGGRIAQAAAN